MKFPLAPLCLCLIALPGCSVTVPATRTPVSNVQWSAQATSPILLHTGGQIAPGGRTGSLPQNNLGTSSASQPGTISGTASGIPDTSTGGTTNLTGTTTKSDATGSSATATFLSMAAPPAQIPQVVPVLDDQNTLQSLAFVPSGSTVSWSLSVSSGARNLTVQSIKLEFQVQTAQATPAPFSPPPLTNRPAVAPTPDPLMTPMATPVPAQPDLTLQKAPGDLGLAMTLKPGSSATLSLDLNSADLFGFLAANPAAQSFSITLTPLDSQGQPFNDRYGKPFSLTTTVSLL